MRKGSASSGGLAPQALEQLMAPFGWTPGKPSYRTIAKPHRPPRTSAFSCPPLPYRFPTASPTLSLPYLTRPASQTPSRNQKTQRLISQDCAHGPGAAAARPGDQHFDLLTYTSHTEKCGDGGRWRWWHQRCGFGVGGNRDCGAPARKTRFGVLWPAHGPKNHIVGEHWRDKQKHFLKTWGG